MRAVGLDLLARQITLLSRGCLTTPPHPVRGFAKLLPVLKPAITDAVDRLSELGMVRRKTHEIDHRSVLIQRTVRGQVFLREIGELTVFATAGNTESNGEGLPETY